MPEQVKRYTEWDAAKESEMLDLAAAALSKSNEADNEANLIHAVLREDLPSSREEAIERYKCCDHARIVAALEAENAALKLQVGRLSAPVTKKELLKYREDYEDAEGDTPDHWHRVSITNFLAARSTPPEPGKEQTP
jgi:hypothetical protein